MFHANAKSISCHGGRSHAPRRLGAAVPPPAVPKLAWALASCPTEATWTPCVCLHPEAKRDPLLTTYSRWSEHSIAPIFSRDNLHVALNAYAFMQWLENLWIAMEWSWSQKICCTSGVSVYGGPIAHEVLGIPKASSLHHEYSAMACTVEFVDDVQAAINHIHRYGRYSRIVL
jgi:hypothetical protein